jgi:hypothetical protein
MNSGIEECSPGSTVSFCPFQTESIVPPLRLYEYFDYLLACQFDYNKMYSEKKMLVL